MSRRTVLTPNELRQLLLRKAKFYVIKVRDPRSTGIRNWCEANGVNNSHVSQFMTGIRPPPNDMLEALGLEWGVVVKEPRR